LCSHSPPPPSLSLLAVPSSSTLYVSSRPTCTATSSPWGATCRGASHRSASHLSSLPPHFPSLSPLPINGLLLPGLTAPWPRYGGLSGRQQWALTQTHTGPKTRELLLPQEWALACLALCLMALGARCLCATFLHFAALPAPPPRYTQRAHLFPFPTPPACPLSICPTPPCGAGVYC